MHSTSSIAKPPPTNIPPRKPDRKSAGGKLPSGRADNRLDTTSCKTNVVHGAVDDVDDSAP